jgi:hypothetical protein
MTTFSKSILSQSSNGIPIAVPSTGTNTTLIHTGPTLTTQFDELWLYASNPSNSDVLLNILIGGTNFTSNIAFEGVIEAYAGNVLIIPGFIINGTGSAGIEIRANVSVANGVNILGYVNTIR